MSLSKATPKVCHTLSNIIYKDIDETYGYGQYGKFKVIMMKSNCYINVTKLCNDNEKQFKHWLEDQQWQDLIEVVKKNSGDPPIIKIMTENKDTCGTYCHSDLMPFIASWISPSFSVGLSQIVNNHIEKEIDEKDRIIARLERKLEEMKKRSKEQ